MSRNNITKEFETAPRQSRSRRKIRYRAGGLGMITCLVVSSTCIRPTLATPRASGTSVNQFTLTPNQGTRGKTSQVILRSVKCDQIKLKDVTLKSPDGSGIDILPGNTSEGDCALSATISIGSDAAFGPVILQLLNGAAPLGAVTFTVSPPQYLISPGRGVPGKEYDVTVSSMDCVQNSLKGAVLTTPRGSGINVSEINSILDQGCSLTAKISIEPDAPYGEVVFRLTNEKGAIFGLVPFLVISKPPEPIPPGLDPEIDVMWSVIPSKIVADNFGRRIAKLYYCIEVIIGNNSGYALQIASTGFTIPALARAAQALDPKLKYTVPANSYKTTRGSIEWEQHSGWRNLSVNLIKGLGPVMTGFTPFFHVTNHRANYSEGVNIFSNPFEKGFELAFPDRTIRNLERLDDQILRDGMIIHNNLQSKTKVFIPKDMVGLSGKEGRDDPQKVMLALGQLVIVGDRIQHINRVRVTSSNEGGPVAVAATIVPAIQAVTQGEVAVLHYNGVGLENLLVERLLDVFEEQDQPKPDEGGRGFSLRVKARVDAKPGTYFLNVTAIQGDSQKTIQIPIEIKAAKPKEITVEPQAIVATANPDGQDILITIKGQFLKGAALLLDQSELNKGLTFKDVDNSRNAELTAKIHIPANFVGRVPFKILNGDQGVEQSFEVLQQGALEGKLEVIGTDSNVARLRKAISFTVKVTGKNLKGAQVELNSQAKEERISVDAVQSGDSDNEIVATISAPKNVLPSDGYALNVRNASGNLAIPFAIKAQPAPVISSPISYNPSELPAPGERRSITITGDNLDGASLEQVSDPDGTLEISSVQSSKVRITATVAVPLNAKAKTYQLEIKNTGSKKPVGFEVRPSSQ